MKILKNKILFVVLLFFSIILLNTTNSQAFENFDYEFTYNNINYSSHIFENKWSYLTIFVNDNKFYSLFSSDPLSVSGQEFSVEFGNYDKYSLSSSDINNDGSLSWSLSKDTIPRFNKILYSNYKIYNSDGNLVFPIPPAVKLVEPLEVGQVLELIQKILTILVPVGLTIFSIFLLVYLIKSRIWRP